MEGVRFMSKLKNSIIKAIKYLLLIVVFSGIIYMFITYSINNI